MNAFTRTGLLIILFFQLTLPLAAQGGIITTYAGPGLPANWTSAVTQSIDAPRHVASDGVGGFYVVSRNQNRVYRVVADGRIGLVAGSGIADYGGDRGPAILARFKYPEGIAVDISGNLYIADSYNNRVRKVTPSGLIITVAGNGIQGYSGDGGQATSAQISVPESVAVDAAGNLFISEGGRIRKVTLNGVITTVAISAELGGTDIAVDSQGNLFASIWGPNGRVRKMTPDGVISTVAGGGTSAIADGVPATSVKLSGVSGIAVDAGENLFMIVENRICMVTPDGTIHIVAGSGTAGFSGDGGPATLAQFEYPHDVDVDSGGNLIVADYVNNRIRIVTPDGLIHTAAGNGTAGFSGEGGNAALAQFNLPSRVAVDSLGNLYIADEENNRIRKVTPDGTIGTVAGDGTSGFSGDGGPAMIARLWAPSGVAVDGLGNLYIADRGNSRIRKVTPDGVIHTIALSNGPRDLALDAAGNLFIAENYNYRIRKVTPDGVISTVAGNGTSGFSGDGGPATSAQLSFPQSIAVDAAGNLFIADGGRIRQVLPNGVIRTFAGGASSGLGDGGLATEAWIFPKGLALDAAGNLFFADSTNQRIRRITPSGVISSVAGNGSVGFSGDGGPALQAELNFPEGVAVDAAGNVFIADTRNHRIRKVTAESCATAFFPQIAVGGGYVTQFTVTNTGSTWASGSLVLVDQQGSPFVANGVLTDSFGTTQPAAAGSAFVFSIPAGGTIFLSVFALSSTTSTEVGWAQLESAGGTLTGMATYEYAATGRVQSMFTVPQTLPLQSATIPVDNDASQDKQVAYAIVNSGNDPISITLALVGQDGSVVDDGHVVTLGPGEQIARYLWQDLGRVNFKGSLVLRGDAGARFVAIALLHKQGFFTMIPLIPGKFPGIQ